MKYSKPIRNTIATLTLAAVGGLAALVGGCADKKPVKPMRSNYDQKSGIVRTHKYSELYISDTDRDGKADILHLFGIASFIAPGHDNPHNAIIMTPEMIEAATRAMKADQELSYLLDKAQYEAEANKK